MQVERGGRHDSLTLPHHSLVSPHNVHASDRAFGALDGDQQYFVAALLPRSVRQVLKSSLHELVGSNKSQQ